MNENEALDQGISIRWFFLPPFTALFTICAAEMLAYGQRVPVDPALWGLTGLLFVILTILYGLFIRQDFIRGLLPVQFIAQGLLLSPLSLHTGAHMLQWVGVTMTVCGAVVLLTLYYHHSRRVVPAMVPSLLPSSDIAVLPLPFAVTDSSGTIVSVSDALLKMTNQSRPGIEGKKITALLPLNEESIELNGKKWRILQTPMEGGSFYFQLEEIHDMPPVIISSRPDGENNFVDPATTLYTRFYAIKRVTEELYRIRRYQRWMSATLLRMTFAYSGTDERPSKEEAIFIAYCQFIRANTRATDITCLVGPRDILVVMPETLLEAAREVAGKLSDFAPLLQEQLKDFEGTVSVREGTVHFGAGTGGLGFDEFLFKLDNALQYGE